METKNHNANSPLIQEMFSVGAHFAFSKSRRHASVKPYIFGMKNKVDIFDLEKTVSLLAKAKEVLAALGKDGKQVLFVGGKAEARDSVKNAALSIGMPYVAGRWIGGTITNFNEVRSRVNKLAELTSQREKGELAKYTKKERLLIDRQIDNLNFYFAGLANLKEPPKAFIVVDPKREHIAVTEAHKGGIPVIALAGSDCDFKKVDYAIAANDASVASIRFFLNELVSAYKSGKVSK